MKPLESIFDNLINGNLKFARERAKRFSLMALRNYAVDDLGWGQDRALKAAAYLKGETSFQDYCDAEHAERSAKL